MRLPTPHNLLQHLPSALAAEQFDTLINTANVRLERIVSHG